MAQAKVRTAAFPVGGLGTRFLPATEALLKEMVPVVDCPLIQYAVDEAIEAGIERFVFVTGRGKSAIEDHFDIACELDATMDTRGKDLSVLGPTHRTPGDIVYVRQQEPIGLGHAVWCVRHVVGDEPFAIFLLDERMVGTPGCMAQTVAVCDKVGGYVLCGYEVPEDQTDRYGIVEPGTIDGDLVEVKGLVEKPARGIAPSNLMIPGRYILQPDVMRILETQGPGAGNEIPLTDARAQLIGRQPFHAFKFGGERYDCGDKARFATAIFALSLAREEIGDTLRDFARARLER